MAEIAFERMMAGVESTHGTGVNPTRWIMAPGVIAPAQDVWRPVVANGMLAEYVASAVTRRWSEIEAEGPADTRVLPMLLSTLVEGGVTPTTPPDGVLTRLWEFVPTMDADTLESLTLFWGDPNAEEFRSVFCMLDELTLEADASGSDGVVMSFSGQGAFLERMRPSLVPSRHAVPLLVPAATQVWFDTAPSAIGTTLLSKRVVSASITIQSGLVRKWLAAGPDTTLDFSAVGRGRRHAELTLVLEVPDGNQFDAFAEEEEALVRVRFGGPRIEVVAGPTTYSHYVEFDIYGQIESLEWGENETNRTAELTILSTYNDTAGHDFAIRVQNDSDSL